MPGQLQATHSAIPRHHSLVAPDQKTDPTAVHAPAQRLVANWARDDTDIRAAQALRWHAEEAAMGRARNASLAAARRDADLFDSHCEHLLVRSVEDSADASQLLGTCRVLTPAAAKQAGGYSCDGVFDLVRLARQRPHLAELGHAWVAPDERRRRVAQLMWLQVGSFLWRNDIEQLIVCVPLPMADGGRLASNVWNVVRQSHLAPIEEQVRPRLALPVEQLATESAVSVPPEISHLLRRGAKLLGPPAWNTDRGVAELPLMLRRQHLPAAWRRRLAIA